MAASAQINKYLNNHYEGMEPEQLILMLFKGALERIRLTREGIEEKNIQKRGENLSKTIAIISELNTSMDTTMNDESTLFLRGLYTAILEELPKVSINNDIEILRRTQAYITELKDIWEKDVIGKTTGLSKDQSTRPRVIPKKPHPSKNYSSGTGKMRFIPSPFDGITGTGLNMHKDINHITGILDTINQMQTAHIQSFKTELMPDLASQLTQRKIQFDELKSAFDLFISKTLPHHTEDKESIVAELIDRINIILEQNKILEKKIEHYKYSLQESIKEISRGRKAIGFYGSPSSSINKPRAINFTN